eukprot:539915_1
MFITNNLVGILHDHDDKVVSYLDVIHCIIVYVEFSGLIILFLFLTCCCLLGKINLIIDTINYIKSWSTFTLFYAFRPTAIFNFYKTIYNHQISTEQQNEKNKCNKYKLLLQQINHEIEQFNEKNTFVEMYKLEETKNRLQALIDTLQLKHAQDKDNNNHISIRDIADKSCSLTSWFSTLINRTRIVCSWLILTLICVSLLLIGMVSLLFKISKFEFIHHSDISSISLYDIYIIIAFCNQLWNITNIEAIKIDLLYQFIFIDAIKCKYTRYVSQSINILDSKIKTRLWQCHGIHGKLMSLYLDWKTIYKIIIKDSIDVLSISQCINLQNQNIYTQKHGKFIKSKTKWYSQFTTIFDGKTRQILNVLRRKSKWRPIHCFTMSQYTLMRHSQKQIQFKFTINATLLFYVIKYVLKYIIQALFGITYLFLLLCIVQYNKAEEIQCDSEGDQFGDELLLFSCIGYSMFIVTFIVINKCGNCSSYTSRSGLHYVCVVYGSMIWCLTSAIFMIIGNIATTQCFIQNIHKFNGFILAYGFIICNSALWIMTCLCIVFMILSYLHVFLAFIIACLWVIIEFYLGALVTCMVVEVYLLCTFLRYYQIDTYMLVFCVWIIIQLIIYIFSGFCYELYNFYIYKKHKGGVFTYSEWRKEIFIVSLVSKYSDVAFKCRSYSIVMCVQSFLFIINHVIMIVLIFYYYTETIIGALLPMSIACYILTYFTGTLYIISFKKANYIFWFSQINAGRSLLYICFYVWLAILIPVGLIAIIFELIYTVIVCCIGCIKHVTEKNITRYNFQPMN